MDRDLYVCAMMNNINILFQKIILILMSNFSSTLFLGYLYGHYYDILFLGYL